MKLPHNELHSGSFSLVVVLGEKKARKKEEEEGENWTGANMFSRLLCEWQRTKKATAGAFSTCTSAVSFTAPYVWDTITMQAVPLLCVSTFLTVSGAYLLRLRRQRNRFLAEKYASNLLVFIDQNVMKKKEDKKKPKLLVDGAPTEVRTVLLLNAWVPSSEEYRNRENGGTAHSEPAPSSTGKNVIQLPLEKVLDLDLVGLTDIYANLWFCNGNLLCLVDSWTLLVLSVGERLKDFVAHPDSDKYRDGTEGAKLLRYADVLQRHERHHRKLLQRYFSPDEVPLLVGSLPQKIVADAAKCAKTHESHFFSVAWFALEALQTMRYSTLLLGVYFAGSALTAAASILDGHEDLRLTFGGPSGDSVVYRAAKQLLKTLALVATERILYVAVRVVGDTLEKTIRYSFERRVFSTLATADTQYHDLLCSTGGTYRVNNRLSGCYRWHSEIEDGISNLISIAFGVHSAIQRPAALLIILSTEATHQMDNLTSVMYDELNTTSDELADKSKQVARMQAAVVDGSENTRLQCGLGDWEQQGDWEQGCATAGLCLLAAVANERHVGCTITPSPPFMSLFPMMRWPSVPHSLAKVLRPTQQRMCGEYERVLQDQLRPDGVTRLQRRVLSDRLKELRMIREDDELAWNALEEASLRKATVGSSAESTGASPLVLPSASTLPPCVTQLSAETILEPETFLVLRSHALEVAAMGVAVKQCKANYLERDTDITSNITQGICDRTFNIIDNAATTLLNRALLTDPATHRSRQVAAERIRRAKEDFEELFLNSDRRSQFYSHAEKMFGRERHHDAGVVASIRFLQKVCSYRASIDLSTLSQPSYVEFFSRILSACQTSSFSVEFDHVTFRYPSSPESQAPVLNDVSFIARGGQFIGIVGESGCGKSTILSLILRVFDPTSGVIRVNGFDIKCLPPRWLRKRIGYVGQEYSLCSGTLQQNLLHANLAAPNTVTADPSGIKLEAVRDALAAACALTFVSRKKFKEQTPVGGTATTAQFSGGEVQRLSIARAMMRSSAQCPHRAQLFLLDEATSALDVLTERRIQASLLSQKGGLAGPTMICVAHRLFTLRHADHIIVFNKEGRVEEQGSFEQLVSKANGVFASMVKLQCSCGGTSMSFEPEKSEDNLKVQKSGLSSEEHLSPQEQGSKLMGELQSLLSWEESLSPSAARALTSEASDAIRTALEKLREAVEKEAPSLDETDAQEGSQGAAMHEEEEDD